MNFSSTFSIKSSHYFPFVPSTLLSDASPLSFFFSSAPLLFLTVLWNMCFHSFVIRWQLALTQCELDRRNDGSGTHTHTPTVVERECRFLPGVKEGLWRPVTCEACVVLPSYSWSLGFMQVYSSPDSVPFKRPLRKRAIKEHINCVRLQNDENKHHLLTRHRIKVVLNSKHVRNCNLLLFLLPVNERLVS